WKSNLSVRISTNTFEMIDIPYTIRDICVMSCGEILILDDDDNVRLLDYGSGNTQLVCINTKRIVPNFEYSAGYSSITCTIIDNNDVIRFYSSIGTIVTTSITEYSVVRESVIVDVRGNIYTIIDDEVVCIM